MLEGKAGAGHRRVARHRPRDRRSSWRSRARRSSARRPREDGREGDLARPDLIGRVLNVRDAAQTDALLAELQKEFGDIAILVNNAGITRDNLALRMKDADWDEVMETNLKSVFRLSRAVMRGMMKARWGRIINITSVVGASGNPGQANYAAAKAGIVGMSKSLARELGSRNITVNCVAPGFIDTDMTRALPEAQKDALLAQIPLGRLGQPEDIAAAVAYLASPGGRLHHRRGAARQRRDVHVLIPVK